MFVFCLFCFVFWIFSPLDWLVYRLISCKFAIFSVWQFIIFGAFLSYYVCLKCNKNSEKPRYIPRLAKKHRSEKGQSCWLESVSGMLFHLIIVLKSNLILVTCKNSWNLLSLPLFIKDGKQRFRTSVQSIWSADSSKDQKLDVAVFAAFIFEDFVLSSVRKPRKYIKDHTATRCQKPVTISNALKQSLRRRSLLHTFSRLGQVCTSWERK